jgi:hypothetical protein
MDWRHMPEMLRAGNAVYSELKNLCIWNKSNAGMGSFYGATFPPVRCASSTHRGASTPQRQRRAPISG